MMAVGGNGEAAASWLQRPIRITPGAASRHEPRHAPLQTMSDTPAPPPRRSGLNRGLSALLGPAAAAGLPSGESIRRIALDRLRPGRYQPRTRMDEGALRELADSILKHGVVQPVVVRKLAEGDYEIIAGERRCRAAKLAGQAEVPALVREVSDQNALAIALIENIQREDLNPLEEAQAIKRLLDEFGFTHEQASGAIGRSRSATSNLLRLLNLEPAVQVMLLEGRLEMGHARALLSLETAQQTETAKRVVDDSLTVRETERLVSRVAARDTPAGPIESAPRQGSALSEALANEIRERIAERLHAPVQIEASARGAGRVVLRFESIEKLRSLCEALDLGDIDFD
jgi:ParB family chromosome partitioning protein